MRAVFGLGEQPRGVLAEPAFHDVILEREVLQPLDGLLVGDHVVGGDGPRSGPCVKHRASELAKSLSFSRGWRLGLRR